MGFLMCVLSEKNRSLAEDTFLIDKYAPYTCVVEKR
jgi:hypothetical protein